MKKFIILFVVALFSACSQVQTFKSPKKVIQEFQTNLNAEYKNPEESPLRGEHLAHFKAHPFFPIDLKYRVTADFERITNAEPFQMPTSSGKTRTYEAYAKATFSLDGKSHTLTLYQSHRLREMEEYKNHLFLPFYDETNDVETYAGGRYIDVNIPSGNTIVIDFNQAYQPYCAYNLYDYSCPIVPQENRLNIRIPAGVMYDKEAFGH